MEKEIEELKKRIEELEKRPHFVYYPPIIYPPQNPNYYQPWVCRCGNPMPHQYCVTC